MTQQGIVITGAASGIGRATARSFLDAGWRVALLGRREEALRETAGDRAALILSCDVSDPAQVDAAFARIARDWGRIDALFNNAGMSVPAAPIDEIAVQDWLTLCNVNITGMFLCAREVAPVMLAQKRGTIVNVSSTYGLVGPDQRLYDSGRGARQHKPVDYSVTKSAVVGFTRYLAAYWATSGVRVNTLTPGGVRHQQPDDFVERYSSRTPLGRMAERHEYCGALLFLLSDASSYMTGANLVVDGGWTAW